MPATDILQSLAQAALSIALLLSIHEQSKLKAAVRALAAGVVATRLELDEHHQRSEQPPTF